MFAHITSFLAQATLRITIPFAFEMSCSPRFITFFRKSLSEQQSRRLREHSTGNAQPTGIPSQERHQLDRDGNARVVLRAGGGEGKGKK